MNFYSWNMEIVFIRKWRLSGCGSLSSVMGDICTGNEDKMRVEVVDIIT